MSLCMTNVKCFYSDFQNRHVPMVVIVIKLVNQDILDFVLGYF